MSMFGFGGFDDELSTKVDKLLAGRRSAEQKRNDFLEEQGIDPESLPLNVKGALMAINKTLNTLDLPGLRLIGNSLGLSRVELLPQVDDEDDPDCPKCGHNGDTFLYARPRTWECGECATRWTVPTKIKVTAVKPDPANHDWQQYLRVYAALTKEEWSVETEPVEEPKEDAAEFLLIPEEPRKATPPKAEPQRTFVCFEATRSWGDDATVTPIPTPAPRWKRPEKYPTGSVLRVTDKSSGAQEYVRVGGLFSDTDLVILGTMKPISKASDWTVTEVLDQ